MVPISFDSKFFNSAELKYKTNELEQSLVIWACEHFCTYFLANSFEILTDHKAIILALKKKEKKTYQFRSTRWADRLLPFDYVIRHVLGTTLGMADYLSREPIFEAPLPPPHPPPPPPSSVYGELFVIKTIEVFTHACNYLRVEKRRFKSIKPVEGDRSCDTAFSQSRSNMQIATIKEHFQPFLYQFCLIFHSNSIDQSNFKLSSPLNESALSTIEFLEKFPQGASVGKPASTVVETASASPVRSGPLVKPNRLRYLRSQARRNQSGPPRTLLQSIAIFKEKCR